MGASEDLALSIILLILFSGVESHDVEVFVNDTVAIRCSPNRSVDIQWHHNSYLNYVFAGGRFFLPYKGRFSSEKDAITGDYDLIIPNVTLKDAGWYFCQEELSGHRISETQLTVLYVNLSCSSNMPSDGFVGPNTCGLQQENMTFSCDVKFNGGPPYVIWRSANDSQSFYSSYFKDESSNRRIFNLTFRANSLYDGSVFICDAITPSGRRFSCNSEMIKVRYLLADYENAEKKIQESANCTVRSNLNVQYNWTLKENNERTFLTFNLATGVQLDPKHYLGIHQCEVHYNIRNVACSASVLNVTVNDIQKEQTRAIEKALAIVNAIIIIAILGMASSEYTRIARAIEMALAIANAVDLFIIAILGMASSEYTRIATTASLATEIALWINLAITFALFGSIIYRLGGGIYRRWRERPLIVEMRSAIVDNHETLLTLIDTSQLIDLLKKNGVFNKAQLNSISSKSSPRKKNEALLAIFKDGNLGLRTFCQTIKCLHQSNQSEAAEILIKYAFEWHNVFKQGKIDIHIMK